MGRFLVGLAFVATLAGLWWWSSAAGRAPGRGAVVRAESATKLEPSATRLAAPEVTERVEVRSESQPERRGAERSEPRGELDPLAARVELAVRVTDPAGQALAGIPLRLVPGANDDPPETSAPAPLVTDAEGRARFAGLRPALARAVAPWSLLHELPCTAAPRLVLDPATLSSAEVVSVLPGGGALDVVVRELNGVPAPKGSTLQLRLVSAEERLNPVLSGPQWKADLLGGEALFPWVELGQTWELSAWRPDGTAPTRMRTRGPSVGGERVRIELVLGSDHPVVSFRALDVARRPFASVALEIARRQIFGIDETTVETDAEGRFTLDGEKGFFAQGASSSRTGLRRAHCRAARACRIRSP